MTKSLRTAPQILEHYIDMVNGIYLIEREKNIILKAMRAYSKSKSDIAYEKGYRACQEQYNLK